MGQAEVISLSECSRTRSLNGTTCAKTSISALTNGLMTSKHVCLTRQGILTARSATLVWQLRQC